MGNFLQAQWERMRDHINKKKDEPAQQQNENIYHQKACDKIMGFYRSHNLNSNNILVIFVVHRKEKHLLKMYMAC